MKKQLVSLFTAAITVLSISTSAMATSFEKESNIQVGSYECYMEDGQYYTEIDGETYLVINVDDFTPSTEINTRDISTYSNSWKNNKEVSIDGTSYKGTIDISDGDDSTPIFVGKSAGSAKGFKMYAGFVLGNSYSVTIHLYNSISERWDENETTLTFNLASQNKVLYTGTMVKYYTKACVTFHKDGSTGESTIGYTMSEI